MSKDTITVNMNVHDIPIVVEALKKANKEIERLKEQLNDEIEEELKQSEIMVKKQQEIEKLNNIIEKLEQENAVLKTQVVNKDKYSYGVRMGSDKE